MLTTQPSSLSYHVHDRNPIPSRQEDINSMLALAFSTPDLDGTAELLVDQGFSPAPIEADERYRLRRSDGRVAVLRLGGGVVILDAEVAP